ncbi:MAG: DUF177 domain-containing protein [Nitrospirota bacterium]
MKINVQNIPDEGLLLDLSEHAITLENREILLEGPILGKLSIHKAGEGAVHVRGALSANLRFECSRCLSPFVFTLEDDFYVDCVHEEPIPEKVQHQEHCLYGEELNLHFYTGDMLDLSDVISDQIALETPMAPLCKEDCEGLCSVCKQAIHQSVCGC